MSAKHATGALVLALVCAPLAADNAKPREEGSTSSASSGAHHEASSVSSSSSSSSGSSSPDTSSDRGSSSSALSEAQQRQPRPGTGHGTRGDSHNDVAPYAYDPGSLGDFGYYPYWYGASAGYSYSPYDYAAYRGSPSRTYGSGDTGSFRLLVDPPEARVYVDGYQAGTVDNFDGLFQRLRLSRGRHEIAFKLEGYRTYRIRVYVSGDQTLKIRYDLVRGAGEDVREEAFGSPDDRTDDRWARRGPVVEDN